MKKTLGYYLSAAAAVLALVSTFLYAGVSSSNAAVTPLLIVSVVLSAAVLALTALNKKIPFANMLPVVNSALCMGAVGLATIPTVTLIVLVAMGMNAFTTIQSYVIFAVVAVIAWLLNIVSSFVGIAE